MGLAHSKHDEMTDT